MSDVEEEREGEGSRNGACLDCEEENYLLSTHRYVHLSCVHEFVVLDSTSQSTIDVDCVQSAVPFDMGDTGHRRMPRSDAVVSTELRVTRLVVESQHIIAHRWSLRRKSTGLWPVHMIAHRIHHRQNPTQRPGRRQICLRESSHTQLMLLVVLPKEHEYKDKR